MKISEYPQGYGHLPVINQCRVTSNQVSNRVTSALKGGDIGPVFEAKEDPSHQGVVSVGGEVFIKGNGEGGPHKCN